MPTSIARARWVPFVEPAQAHEVEQQLPLGPLLVEKFKQNGVAGALDGITRLVCVLATWLPHQRVLKTIKRPACKAVLEAFPRVQFRYTMPYLSSTLRWSERRLALQSHYALAGALFKPGFYERVLSDDMILWRQGVGDCSLSMHLQGPCALTRHREGEFTLLLKLDGRPLYRMSFSLVDPDVMRRSSAGRQLSTPVIFVGRVQGAAGAMDTIRLVTSKMGDIAPQDVLMTAVLGVARVVNARDLFGVTDATNIAKECIQRAGASFSYARFWEKYGAEFHADGNVHLSLPLQEKPLSEVSANHRGRTLRKREAKAAIGQQVQASLARWLA